MPGSRPVGCPDRPRYTRGLSACTCAREPTHPPWSVAYAFPSHLLRGAICPPPPPLLPPHQAKRASTRQARSRSRSRPRTHVLTHSHPLTPTHSPPTLPSHRPQALHFLCFLTPLSCPSSLFFASLVSVVLCSPHPPFPPVGRSRPFARPPLVCPALFLRPLARFPGSSPS